MRGKGIGPAPIVAMAIVSTVFVIVLDHFGITTMIQNTITRSK